MSGISFCHQDLNDPDCGITIDQVCYCTDGTSFPVTGLATSEKCNADTTCGPHEGWSQECRCNDGTVVGLSFGQIASAELCNTPTTCDAHGGWGDTFSFGDCDGEFFSGGRSCYPQVRVFDPDTGAVLLDDERRIEDQLSSLEEQAIDDVIATHGLASSDRSRLLAWERGRVRAQILARLSNLVAKPEADRTLEENQIHDWFEYLLWRDRIEPAQEAWNQYLGWKNAVDLASCSWQPPNQVFWKPKATADLTDPQLIDCQSDINIPGLGNVPRLCRFNGCSAGADGVPRTDASPNASASNTDDGELCFESGTFSYDTCTLSRCAGVQNPLLCTFGTTAKPSYEQFRSYGAVIANSDFVYEPSLSKSLIDTTRGAVLLGAVGVLAVGVTAVVEIVWVLNILLLAKIGNAQLFSLFAIGYFAPVASVFVVVLALAIGVAQGITLVQSGSVEPNLKADLRAVASTTDHLRGKPDLAALTTTDAGRSEIMMAFVKAAGREPDLSSRTAPAPDDSRLWSVWTPDNVFLPDESGLDAEGHARPLRVLSWPDPEGGSKVQDVRIFQGWFVIETDGERRLSLSLDYVRPNGEKWIVWRAQCNDETNTSCTFGEPVFVHTRAGDEPPSDLEGDALAAWMTNADPTILYKSEGGEGRLASFNRPPSDASFTDTGAKKEGSAVEFSATANDADGDGIAWSWNFGDGSSPTGGSTVQHTFTDNGSYQVVATPTDALGSVGEPAIRTIVIDNVAPGANFEVAPLSVLPGEAIGLNFAFAGDAGAQDVAAGFTYSFDCSPAGQLNVGGPSSSSALCSFTTPGSYTVSGRIFDKDNGSTGYTAGIEVVTPLSTIQQLREQTIAYRLRGDRQWSLAIRLQRALRMLEQGKPEVAILRLQAYVKTVARMVSAGVLTPQQGTVLTTMATRIIASLQ